MPSEALLTVRGVSKRFTRRAAWGRSQTFWAIRDVTFELPRGRTLGLVGASGCGKSTLARCLARLEMPDSGDISIDGRRAQPGEVQLIPQEPAASFNPRFTAEDAVAEPLVIQKRGNRLKRREAVRQAMEAVGLKIEAAGKPATAFSGGELQRLAIARALMLEPKVLIIDESLSGLDATAQCQIVDLLAELRRSRGLAQILISHDLMMVERVVDEIAIVHEGRIVEHAAASDLLQAPRHPRTRELIAANLVLNAEGPPL